VHGLLLFTLVEFARQSRGALPGEPVYAADAEYPDEAFADLVDRAAAATGRTRAELLREFGRHTALTTFPRLFPDYYASRKGARSFLLGVEDQIHELVRATIEFARPPRLRVAPFGADGVVISYTSERGLCDLLEGLVHGTAEHYGEELQLEQPQCMHRGDIGCVFFVSRADAESVAAV
jgi:hypothetical protein